MAFSNRLAKPLSAFISAAVISATALPTTSAFGHDRYNHTIHYGNGKVLNKKKHRNFHKRFGRGYAGTDAYYYHREAKRAENRKARRLAQKRNAHKKNHKHHKRDKGDLIAAGIIGLAVGAIIAGNASKQNTSKGYRYDDPYRDVPNGGYKYDGYKPLSEYDNGYNGCWYQWCQNNYRSFDAQRGTFRGYDGKDHFCVVK